jgi:4-methyl-5(b-hydroxyethyl)-thiazole monophosphate biosynthesis
MGFSALVTIADGVEEMEAVCIIDVLRRGGVDVTVASVDDMEIVASRGVKLVADVLIDQCEGQVYDIIALPGGMGGAEAFANCDLLIGMLREQKSAGRIFSAICASPALVFSRHGLIDDKEAVCHPGVLERLKCAGKVDGRVVVDGNCVTSKGPGTAIEFALKLLELTAGSEKAGEVAGPMILA